MNAPLSIRSARRLSSLLGGLCASLVLVTCESPPDPPDPQPDPPAGALRVLALGNSITQADADHLSYRYPLWQRFVDDGIPVDFVGSQREHFSGVPDFPSYAGQTFDADHEGHWGWRIDEVLSGRGGDGLADWLQGYDADVVLMHLGSNDVFQDNDLGSSLAELRQVVRVLRSDNPAITILWARLLPTTDAPSTAAIAELNDAAAELAMELTTGESPIHMVDLNSGFDATALTYDGVHPNAEGEAWMASRWYSALESALPVFGR